MSVDLGSGRGWLNAGPAASIRRIDRSLGHPLQITEAGRTWAQQNAHWLTYQRAGYPIALHPDAPSIHQLGAAIDSDEAQQHLALMLSHGWIRTVYRNGKLVEPWHFEYSASRDQHINETAPASAGVSPVTPDEGEEEDEDMAMKGAHYTRSRDNQTVHLLFNEVSGFYVEHSGVPGDYNNEIARNWGTNSWAKITEAHAAVIKRSLDAIRRTAVTGSLSVDIDA